MTSIMNVIEPLNYEQAKDKEEWVTAMIGRISFYYEKQNLGFSRITQR